MSDNILNKFDLHSHGSEELDEKTLHRALAGRIAEMLDHDTDLLFSTLYRLDVLEYKIKEVLEGRTNEEIAFGLARLVIERQKDKMKTRKNLGESPQFKDF